VGEDDPFSVQIAKSKIVAVLKNLIEKPYTFAGIKMNFIDLYRATSPVASWPKT
jgi:hypothetical protein